jgi:hypothetical protein
MVFVKDYPDLETMMERIREIDNSQSLYESMLPVGGEESNKKLTSFQEDIYSYFKKM